MKRLIIFLLTVFISSVAIATPSKPSVAVTGTVAVTGSGFGTKTTAAPVYYSNFDSESVVADIPAGQVTNLSQWGTVKANIRHSGAHSEEWDMAATAGEYFSKNAIDFGVSGSNEVFVTAWVYVAKQYISSATGLPIDTTGSWSWKWMYISSRSDMYSGTGPNDTFVTANPYWSDSRAATYGQGWLNAGWTVYYNGESNYNTNLSTPYDLIIPGQWQRVTWYMKRSSSGGVADGIQDFSRYGRDANATYGTVQNAPMLRSTTVITHDTGNDPWRYVNLNTGLKVLATDQVQFNLYMDDVYVDNTLARVEMCDSATWAARTHCEIQPTTAWNANGAAITSTYNPGAFVNGQSAYFYVVDSTGTVSPASDAYTVGNANPDATSPTTTTNRAAGRYQTTQTVTLACSDDVACTATSYCLTLNASCTPSIAYTAPFKWGQNTKQETFCAASTDGTNAETARCWRMTKQKRKP